MSEEHYSNREIDSWRVDTKDQLNRIETQVTKTNGRVNSLENWKWMIMGGMSIISMFVIPLAIYIFTHQ